MTRHGALDPGHTPTPTHTARVTYSPDWGQLTWVNAYPINPYCIPPTNPTPLSLTLHTSLTLNVIRISPLTLTHSTHHTLCTPHLTHAAPPHLTPYTFTIDITKLHTYPPLWTQSAMEAVMCKVGQVRNYSTAVEDLVYYNTSSCYPLWEAYATAYTATCVNLLGSLVSCAYIVTVKQFVIL